MFNGENLLNLNYTVINADSYEEALNKLDDFIVSSFQKTGKLVQPTVLTIDDVICNFSKKKITTESRIISKPRPLTYVELLSVFVELYNSGDQGIDIIENSIVDHYCIFDTVSSIIYASPERENYLVGYTGDRFDRDNWTYKYKQGAKFKVVEISDSLMNISKSETIDNGGNPILLADYDAVEGREFIMGKQAYNKDLTKSQFANHRGFNALMPDKKLRSEVIKITAQMQKNLLGVNPKDVMIEGFELDNPNRNLCMGCSYERQLRIGLHMSSGISTFANFSFKNYSQSGHFSFLAITPKE